MTSLAACSGAWSHEQIRCSYRNTGACWLLMNDNKFLLLRQRKIKSKLNVNGSVKGKAGRPRDGSWNCTNIERCSMFSQSCFRDEN